MFIEHDPEGYHFTAEGIKNIEDLKGAKYIGYWCTKRPSGGWNEMPVDVFYVEEPNRALGHSNYFGMFRTYDKQVMITNAESCFSEPLVGAVCDDGEVIVSRYRHDYVEKKGAMIDGGRDYNRTNGCKIVQVELDGAEFTFKEFAKEDI